ncbi:MAG: recombinase RecT [Desulfofustis sp.]|nr:recombinase RecT [Desulfofustis sp.]
MTEENKALVESKSVAERFALRIVGEFTSNTGGGILSLSPSQQRLAQNYFIAIDSVLKAAEEKRLKKTGKYQDQVPIVWANVNMESLARNVVAAARIGWDPLEKNHVSMIPYKNNTTGKYDLGFIPGYRGLELKAKKYALDLPDNVIVELVYSTDKFKSYKKNRDNNIESFDFEITNDFDRGEILGGFYYHEYFDNPERNRLVVMPMKEIQKRKPKYASAEFWGGEKPAYKNGQKSGTETVDGWFEKMCWKTVYRAAYADLTIDSQKIDDVFKALAESEAGMRTAAVEDDYRENANGDVLDVEAETVPDNVDPTTGEVKQPETEQPPQTEEVPPWE